VNNGGFGRRKRQLSTNETSDTDIVLAKEFLSIQQVKK
jgi:hypothetical protein